MVELRKLGFWLAFLALLAGGLGFLGAVCWIFDLFNHFRPQMVVGNLVLSLIFARIDRKICAIFIVVFLLNLSVVGYRIHAFIPKSDISISTSQQLSILTANVLMTNNNYGALLSTIKSNNPDVIALLEVNASWTHAISQLKKDYPHFLELPSSSYAGLAIYSKQPFTHEIRVAGYMSIPLLVLNLKGFTMLVAHPMPPISSFHAAENSAYLKDLAMITKEFDRVLVAGDLNTTLWSHSISPLIGNGLEHAGLISYTWPAFFFPAAIQIDHYFAKNISVSEFEVLDGIDSDHFPIKATITLPN